MKFKHSLYIVAILIAFNVSSQTTKLNIGAGAKVTVKSGAKVKVIGDVVIKANASEMGSLLLDDNAGTAFDVTGDSDVEVYLVYDQWHMISPPISDAIIKPFLDIYLKTFNETINDWEYLWYPLTAPMNVMQGYAIWAQTAIGTNIFTHTGTLNNGPLSNTTLTNSSTGLGEGWNLIGNPYPCAIDLDVVSGWSQTNVNSSVYYWNGTQYVTYLAEGLGGDGSGTGGSRYAPSNQGFFIHCNNTSGGSITVNNNARLHNSASFYKNTKSFDDFLRLNIEGNNYKAELVVRFDSNASLGFDGNLDAYKLFGVVAAPQLYTLTPNIDSIMLAINTMDAISSNMTIPLFLQVGNTGTYVITASELGSFDPGVKIYLEDLKTTDVTNLVQNQVYSFTADTNDNKFRFLLRFDFQSSSVDTPIDETPFYVYSFDKNIFININELDGCATIRVFDVLGREVQSLEADKAGLMKISLHEQPNAIYFVSLETTHRIYTEKIYLK